MRKGNDKKQAAKKDTWNLILITLSAWEYVEGNTFDRLKCSAYAGKNDKGEYNQGVHVSVMIGDKCECDEGISEISSYTKVNVAGELSFDRRTVKGKEYLNVTIWATNVKFVEE